MAKKVKCPSCGSTGNIKQAFETWCWLRMQDGPDGPEQDPDYWPDYAEDLDWEGLRDTGHYYCEDCGEQFDELPEDKKPSPTLTRN
jgi:DNA-directed RNA polymerase subunit RPC12/RpoP